MNLISKINIVISYDISNNKLRRKIEKTLKNYGIRIQYSIFNCHITVVQKIKIQTSLDSLLKKYCNLISDSDSIIVFENINTEKIKFILGNTCNFEKYVVY